MNHRIRIWKGLRDHLVHPFSNCVLQKSRSLGDSSSRSDMSNRKGNLWLYKIEQVYWHAATYFMAPQKIRSAINSQAYFTMKFFPAGSLLKFYRTKGRQNEASDSLLLFQRRVVSLFCDPWAVAHQAPLSVGFSRQEHWSGFLFPSPRDLPTQGLSQCLCLASRFFTPEPPGKP